jgi:ribonucleotide reductase alpha subunit
MSRSNHTGSGSKKAYSEDTAEMKVIKRNGKMENISFDKILRRLKKIGKDKNIKINFASLAIRIIDQLYTKIPTTKIDELTAEQCASMSSISPDYETIALHIIVSNHHKNTRASFSETMNDLYNFRDINGAHSPLVADDFIAVVRDNAELFDNMCDFSRDYLLSYFGFKTLEKSYLMHINKRIVERPQHMWLRVAIGIHGRDLENVRKTYELMSQKKFTHATPTLFNSGTPRPQLSSCFLLAMDDDSIEGIFQTISECALISKWSGGIGVACSKIRAKGSIIRGTNGRSNGIVPMLRVFNSTCLYVDQCVLPETPIYTTRGPMQIQDVRAGETAVYNLTGETEVVQNVLEHAYDGEMRIIKSPYFDELRVTPQHPIAVIRLPVTAPAPAPENIRSEKEMPGTSESDRYLDAQWREFLESTADVATAVEWVDAGELRPGYDMIVYRIPGAPAPAPARELDDCYMYGLMIHGGSPFDNTNNCMLKVYNKFTRVKEFVEAYMENHCCKYTTAEKKNSIKDWNMTVYEWRRNIYTPFRQTDFITTGGGHAAFAPARMHPDWTNLPNTHIKQILRGLIDAYSPVVFGNKIYYENRSRELIEDVRFLWLRLGVLVETGHQKFDDDTKVYFMKIPYTNETAEILNLDENIISLNVFYNLVQNVPFKKHGDYLFAPVSSNTSTEYSGVLYDLQMSTEHNYMIHQGVVHNGGGKRNGSFAIYLEPWHADVEDFLQMRKNHGDENLKARDLFYALWIPDLFMKRVKTNGEWTLMCPNECPGLCDVYGEEFEELYMKYEREHRGRRTIKARDLWFQILDAQMETGTPYLVYKDAVNKKSNQKNIGTIKSSNLCVAPETTILTENGFEVIKDLWGKKVNVWNGAEYSNVEIVKTGENQELIDIYIQDGSMESVKLSCTLYHKFYMYNGEGDDIIKEAQELSIGDRLKDFILPNETDVHKNVTIVDIKRTGRHDDTYCFTEPIRHAGIFNGILTSQCSEIVEFTDKNETAVCNLASIALPAYVKHDENGKLIYDFEELHEVAKVVTYNLNRVIDVNYYPNEKTRRSNMRHRPIGIGVQGLADVFMMMKYPFDSPEARELNRNIFETIYHAAVESSCDIACKEGAYETFPGSPASQGLLQFDLWGVDPGNERYNWTELKERVRAKGIRNSLLMAPMPTASTSQILGYNECFEPITSNIYSRRTLAGDFIVPNKYLLKDLQDMGLWNKEMKDEIIKAEGSIQSLTSIPEETKKLYKTVWEISQKALIEMAADRGCYVCQSMSLNLWLEDPAYTTLTSMHFYAYEKGLKTGIYYLRRRARHQAQQFTIKPEKATVTNEVCEMCSS